MKNPGIPIQQSVNLKIRIVDNEDEFYALQTEWDELVQHSNATIYQTFEWLSCWWKYYNEKKYDDLHCLLFYHNEKLVGIAPLYIRNKYFLGLKFFRRAYFLGGSSVFGLSFGLFFDEGPSDYLDVISLPEYEQTVAESLLLYTQDNQSIINEIVLVNLKVESLVYRNLIPLLRDSSIRWKISEGEECPYIKTPDSLDGFFKSRSSSVRRRLLQSWKEAEEKSLFKLNNPNTIDEILSSFSEIKRLHQVRWNRLGYPGFFGDTRYQFFFNAILFQFSKRGWLWCKTINASNNNCIAGRLAFRFKDGYYDYLSGIDDLSPEAKRRPGLVILLSMINDAITTNARGVDLLRGDEPYKKDFTLISNRNWNLSIYLNNKDNFFRTIFFDTLLGLKFLNFLVSREIKLFKLQYYHKPFPNFISFYIKIRTRALIKKINFIRIKMKDNR